MMHPFELCSTYNADNYVVGFYVLKTGVSWKNEDQVVEAFVKTNSSKKQTVKLKLLKGALWSDDSFAAKEDVLVYINKQERTQDLSRKVCLIVSKRFFESFIYGADPTQELKRMKDLLKLPTEMCRLALSFVNGEKKEFDEDHVPDFLEPVYIDEYYHTIEPYLLPEQRQAYESWKRPVISGGKGHSKEKLKYLLSISPSSPFHDKYDVTYESIVEVFDKYVVGQDNLKHSLAVCLAENYHKLKKRGIRILLHGLPGTGKTSWGGVIAEAMHLKYKVVNLGDKSSTLSLNGCESSYEDSEPGNILKFFYKCKTSETVIVWDELDKLAHIGEVRGKDGHVMECLLPILDPDRTILADAFLDEVPINCENTISICTANRIDNVPPEVLNRMDMIFSMSPYEESTLMKILYHSMPTVEAEYHLGRKWIEENALKRMICYRGDFGARDVRADLKVLAAYSRDNNQAVITDTLVDEILPMYVDTSNRIVRYHLNETKYTREQRQAILEAVSRRSCADNLSEQERRALDLKIDCLTRLIPQKVHPFNADVFFKTAGDKLHGMEKIQQAIAAEFYASSEARNHPEPILLVGPPGVGKTSLIEAIAESTGRKYIRLQMSGITDADFIQGQIAEKVAANPGKLVQKMVAIESTSPLIYFDEIEKIGQECAQTLFDVFDDNPHVHDRFLDFSVDLSSAQLICSANDVTQIHPALLNRMKIIRCSGYSASEKQVIAREYLIPSITRGISITMDDDAIDAVLKYYENDCGIRSMKHGLSTVVHECMLNQRNNDSAVSIHVKDVERILGAKPYTYLAEKKAGCVNGLATYGDAHGLVMPIKVTLLHNGEKRITGLPEASIRDSILVAETWLEEEFNVSLKDGYHIHFSPAGTKKDGPSAGVGIAICMLSAITGSVIGEVAFSGEFDGSSVLPVGGVALKVQAAKSAGIKKVYLPEGCSEDLNSDEFKDIEIVFVSKIQEIVKDLFPSIKKDHICVR